MRPSPALLAFVVATLGIAVFSTMDAVIKSLALAIGTYDTLLWRSFAGIPISGLPWLARRPKPPLWPVLRLHIMRGVVSAAMAFLFFWGLVRTPMAQAVALTFIAPLIAMGLAALLLGERPPKRAILGAGVAALGVACILAGVEDGGPVREDGWLGPLAILASGGCYAYNIILMRRQAQVADPFEIAFFQTLVVAIALAFAAPFFAGPPPAAHAPMILVSALFATVSLALLSWAYARAPASYLVTTEYTSFAWASGYGYWLFGEHISAATIAGALLIIAGCIVAARAGAPPQAAGELPI